MQNKLLSICIPTYNRDWCLKELINELKSQITDDLMDSVEVIFSDNCSNDYTQNLLVQYQNSSSYVKYYRNDTNIGFAQNYLRVISYASGLYTWVLGDDDLPAENAVKDLLNEIKRREKIDIILFNFSQKDIYMKKNINGYIAFWDKELIFNLSNDRDMLRYLNNAKYSHVLFSYISSYIFKTSKFALYSVKENLRNHPFIHMFYIWQHRKRDLSVCYINKFLLLNRSGNDRISDNLYDIVNVFLSGIIDLCDEYFVSTPKLYYSISDVSKKYDNPCNMKFILRVIKNINQDKFIDLVKKIKKLKYPKLFILFMYLKYFIYNL